MSDRHCPWENSLLPNHNVNISDKQGPDNKTKIRILQQAVQEGMDEIDRGEFVVVEPDDISSFVDKLAANALKRMG